MVACRHRHSHSKAVIVHPRFVHTLRLAPESATTVGFHALPEDALSLVADHLGQLDTVTNLLRFEQVNKHCRYGMEREHGMCR